MTLRLNDVRKVAKFVADKYNASSFEVVWDGNKDFFSPESHDRRIRFDFPNDLHAVVDITLWLSVYFSNNSHNGPVVPDTMLYDELRGYLDTELKRLFERRCSDAT